VCNVYRNLYCCTCFRDARHNFFILACSIISVQSLSSFMSYQTNFDHEDIADRKRTIGSARSVCYTATANTDCQPSGNAGVTGCNSNNYDVSKREFALLMKRKPIELSTITASFSETDTFASLLTHCDVFFLLKEQCTIPGDQFIKKACVCEAKLNNKHTYYKCLHQCTDHNGLVDGQCVQCNTGIVNEWCCRCVFI
jgi:hypothetical protein